MCEFSPSEQAAIDTYFEGDRDFFLAYRDSCLRQLVDDVAAGDQACSLCDPRGLRRVVHTLKGILKSLGREELAALAQTLESELDEQTWSSGFVARWEALARVLR